MGLPDERVTEGLAVRGPVIEGLAVTGPATDGHAVRGPVTGVLMVTVAVPTLVVTVIFGPPDPLSV
jgi:hypothetical protein